MAPPWLSSSTMTVSIPNASTIDRERLRGKCHLSARQTNCRTSSLLDGREQPITATRTHKGPQFGDLAPLAAFDGASARALDHAVLERKFHGQGRIIGIAFAPGFR